MIEFWIECHLEDETKGMGSVWKKFRAPTLPRRNDWVEFQSFGPGTDPCAYYLHREANFHFEGDECFIYLEAEVDTWDLDKLRAHNDWTATSPLKAFQQKHT